jgi:hypothetical protein
MIAVDEFTRINRGIRRRINRGRPLDSYPFLSGDSYFFSCQFFYRDGSIQEVSEIPGRRRKVSSLFVSIANLKDFISFLHLNSKTDFGGYTLVIHNGDDPIVDKNLNYLQFRFRKIFAVNIMTANSICRPIPIGIENKKFFTNGVPHDFEKLISAGLAPPAERSTLLLQAFSNHTNPSEREKCAAVALSLGAKRVNSANPKEYRRELASSKFVLSPAGNGIDCHRTWEALYLGAIPIVKRAHWPFSSYRLPVLIVTNWEELKTLDLNGFSLGSCPDLNDLFWEEFFSN